MHWAESYGPQTTNWCNLFCSPAAIPSRPSGSCLGILASLQTISAAQVERACQMAREEKSLNYQAVKTLLDLIPPIPESVPLPAHENIRGHSYYQ